MDYTTLFLDLDGTVLQPDDTYSLLTKKAIQEVQEKGIEVFFATGRPSHEILDLAEALNVSHIIGYNGSHVRYKNEVIFQQPIAGEIIDQYVAISERNNHVVVFYTEDRNYFTRLDCPIVKGFIEHFDLRANEQYTPRVRDKILGITIMKLEEEKVPLYELNEDMYLAQVNIDGLRHCFDLIRTDVNKGVAVSKVISYLQLEKDQTIAFGDGLNDLEMFEAVGESFAMGNAHPTLKKLAKHITSPVIEDGIYNGLKKLGLVGS